MGNKAIASVKRAGKALPRKWEPKPKFGPQITKSRRRAVVLNKH